MTGLTTYGCNAVLNWATGKLPTPTITNPLVGLFTTVGNDDGTGFVEVSGVSYARVQTTPASWDAPSGTKPVQITNIRSVAFAVAGSNWGTIAGFGLFDTNGNLLWFDYAGNFPWLPFTAATGANGVFLSPTHGFAFNDQVILTGEYGGLLPQATTSLQGLLTIGNVTTDQFTVGANVTVAGSGMLRKVLPVSAPINQSVVFNPSALVLQLA